MYMPRFEGLLPKLVTWVNDAADAGRATRSAPATTNGTSAAVSTARKTLFTADPFQGGPTLLTGAIDRHGWVSAPRIDDRQSHRNVSDYDADRSGPQAPRRGRPHGTRTRGDGGGLASAAPGPAAG